MLCILPAFPEHCDSEVKLTQTECQPAKCPAPEEPLSGDAAPKVTSAGDTPEVPSNNQQAQQLESDHVHKVLALTFLKNQHYLFADRSVVLCEFSRNADVWGGWLGSIKQYLHHFKNPTLYHHTEDEYVHTGV